MVNKCCAFGCKSGYIGKNTTTGSGVRITFHSFPQHKDLRDKWIRANPRRDFVPSKHSRMCSLHFRDSDFVEQPQDSNARRRKQLADDQQLKCRYLKKDAVPTVFLNVPSYLTSPAATPRRAATSTSASSRRQQQHKRLETLQEAFEAEDDISQLTPAGIKEKLTAEAAVPGGFHYLLLDGTLAICRMRLVESVPEVQAAITVPGDLTVAITLDGKEVASSHYRDLQPTGSLQTMSQLLNVMARVSCWCDDSQTRPTSLLLQTAIKCLRDHISSLDDNCDEHRKMSFILEQLQLSSKSKYKRHYSPQLTVFSYIVHATSSAAYEVLLQQNVLCLPSVNTLSKVTRQVNSSSGLDNTAYLNLRISKLNAFQRNVVLIIDEIYIAKRVEYSGGEVQGLTADGSVASTLLCFMVKSLVGKFKDVVSVYPMTGLTAAKQYDCYTEVMAVVRKVGLNVIAISVDNASTNRKFFIDFLCCGSLTTSIIDSDSGQPIFLIFDPVHDLKNVYNNFQSRKVFKCPTFDRNLPNGCHADFNHIVGLYNLEASSSLKKAHKLSPAALNPKSIEKTSVTLATSVFAESTRDALRYYAEHDDRHAEWRGTADFISLVLKLWNVMNVKSSCKGKHKRDYTMDPVRSSQDWKLCFLREFAEFLQRWEAVGKDGFTRETFLALRHTCLALADCAAYLLDRLGFNFVLLGQLQSDALESRFGWLRQLSGANYYISMRQVLESDRKIRALSLLKFSKVSLSDIEDAAHANSAAVTSASDADNTADVIADSLKLDAEPSESDENIIFYVSGAIARSTVACTKCDHCKEALVCSNQLPVITVEEELDHRAAEFLDCINRGGLTRPSDFTYKLVRHCWRVFEELWNRPDLKSTFLLSPGQRLLFCKIMDRATYTEKYLDLLFGSSMCTAGHDMQAHIVRRFFNCVAKNFVKQITAAANQQSGPLAKKRKIAKLSSMH